MPNAVPRISTYKVPKKAHEDNKIPMDFGSSMEREPF
jgi:hypothetical protein